MAEALGSQLVTRSPALGEAPALMSEAPEVSPPDDIAPGKKHRPMRMSFAPISFTLSFMSTVYL